MKIVKIPRDYSKSLADQKKENTSPQREYIGVFGRGHGAVLMFFERRCEKMNVAEYNTRLNSDRLPILAECGALLADGRKSLSNADYVFDIARSIIGDFQEEHAIAFYLDTKLKLIGFSTVGIGSVDHCIFDIRGIFQKAFFLGACKLILAHNHPSGDCSPSSADIEVTKQAVQAGELLNIPVLDHLIVGDGTYSSLRGLGHIK